MGSRSEVWQVRMSGGGVLLRVGLEVKRTLLVWMGISVLSVLLIVVSAPVVSIWPIVVSIIVVMFLWVLFEVKKYVNIKVYMVLTVIILFLGTILSYSYTYTSIDPLGKELFQLNSIFVIIIMSITFYSSTHNLKIFQ